MPPGRGQDEAVGKTARDNAAEIIVRVFLRRAEQGDQIEIMAGKDRLHAIEHAHEERVALAGDLGAGLHHEADDVGCALAQARPDWLAT